MSREFPPFDCFVFGDLDPVSTGGLGREPDCVVAVSRATPFRQRASTIAASLRGRPLE